tara:strand:+ start:1160 stop:2044 length:885 start_codon:yes stop_codon:yes gene_type:complete
MKKKINKTLLFVGGGRWAKIWLSELIKKIDLKKIYVLTSNNLIKKKNYKNFIHIKKISEVKLKNIDKIIIANKTKDHLKYLKKFNNLKKSILVEKPFTNDVKDFFNIKSNKANIFLGLQFSFAIYFFLLKKKIKNDQIKLIQIDWFDNPNEKKKFNNQIYFLEDVYYHFYSIIRIFAKNIKSILNKRSLIIFNNITTNYKDTKIILNASNKKKIKTRKILIQTNKNKYLINFVNMKKIIIKKDGQIYKKITKNIKNLPLQILYFLNNHNKIKVNSLNKLTYLFKDLRRIKNTLN